MDTTMRISIEAEISEERESCTFFKLKTGFGDPIVIVHKDNFKVEESNPLEDYIGPCFAKKNEAPV